MSGLDRAALLRAYDEQLRPAEIVNLAASEVVEHDGPIARILGMHRGFISAPADLGLAGDEVDALIARQRDVFAARSEPVEWKTRAHDRPFDLVERLVAAGFRPEDEESVLVGLAAPLADAAAPLPDGVTVRQSRDRADMVRIAEMESTVWNADWSFLADDLCGRIERAPDEIAVLLAEADGVVVSAAWVILRRWTEFACLWGGSTRPEWRGRGIYRSLVARRAALALQAGARYLQVDASDASRPVLERLGFVVITTTTPYVYTPASS